MTAQQVAKALKAKGHTAPYVKVTKGSGCVRVSVMNGHETLAAEVQAILRNLDVSVVEDAKGLFTVTENRWTSADEARFQAAGGFNPFED